MNRIGSIVAVFVLSLCAPGMVFSEIVPAGSSISIQGKSEVVVTEPSVRLADVAHVESPRVQDDEAMVLLRKITIAASPKTGESIAIEGTKVLERLRDEGVRLENIRYTLPRQIAVTRAFREVGADELEKALLSFLEKSDRQIELKRLVVDKPIRIATDSNGIEVVGLHATHSGHFGVDYRALSKSDESRFQLRAFAEEWRTVPVASRPLKRGDVVSAGDIELSRVSKARVTRDAIENLGDLVGYQLTRNVGQGEMLSAAMVMIPPVIKAGSRVTLLFKQGRLEVTASGVALESGIRGAEIKVRNDSSKKIVSGKVVEDGLVAVGE
jgi:flagella basal body P-ring formation protein FlgA